MPYFPTYRSMLLPLFCVVIITHNCCTNLIESHTVNCSQVDCIKICPADSWPKSITLINYDEDENVYDDIDLNEYEYDEYGSLRFDFENDNDANRTHVNEPFPPSLRILNDNHDSGTKYRKQRHVKIKANITKCCGRYNCICKKCNEIPLCPVGEVAVLVQKGQGIPGTCCSDYKCKEHNNCTELILNKQPFWRTKCIECRCIGKMEFCKNYCSEKESLQNCYSDYWQKPILNGGHWKEGPCTSCTCKQGEKKCVTSICPKLPCQEYIIEKDLCCPICRKDDIYQDNEKHFKVSPDTASNQMKVDSILFTPSKVEPSTFIKPLHDEEIYVSTHINFNFNKEKQDDKFSTETESFIQDYNYMTSNAPMNRINSTNEQHLANKTTHNKTLKHSIILNNITLSNVISVTSHNITTKKRKLDKTSIINDIFHHPLSTGSTTFTKPTFKENVYALETSTIKSTNNRIQLVEPTDTPNQTKFIVLTVVNTTKSTSYNTSTFSIPCLPNTLHFNKTLLAKEEGKQHSMLLNDLIFVVTIGVLSLTALSISLGLIILFIKNRRKMYSCIPNSEASLSQTLTNTIVTI